MQIELAAWLSHRRQQVRSGRLPIAFRYVTLWAWSQPVRLAAAWPTPQRPPVGMWATRRALPTYPQAQHQQKQFDSLVAQGSDTARPMTRFHRGIPCRDTRGTEQERSGQITSYENRTC